MQNASKDVEQKEFLFIAGGNEKWYKVWQLLIYNLSILLTIQSRKHIPWYSHKTAENLLPHKNLNMDV